MLSYRVEYRHLLEYRNYRRILCTTFHECRGYLSSSLKMTILDNWDLCRCIILIYFGLLLYLVTRIRMMLTDRYSALMMWK